MVKLLDLPDGSLTMLDDADWTSIAGYCWYRTVNGYVAAMTVLDGRRTSVLMHRLVTGAPAGTHVDHMNGDTLDNRRVNLRVTTPSRNQVNRKRLNRNNTSGARGVSYRPTVSAVKPWRAQITVLRKNHHLGLFATRAEAIEARRTAELHHFGELCP